LAKSGMVQFPPDVLIEASSLRNKAKILEKLNNPAAQQAQQEQAEMMKQGQQAEVAKTSAEAQSIGAKAQLEAQLEPMKLEIEKRKLDLDEARMQFENRKLEVEAAAAERDAQAGAGDVPIKAGELAVKDKVADADVVLKHAQAELALANAGKARADVEIGAFTARTTAEHQNRQLDVTASQGDRKMDMDGQRIAIEDKRADREQQAKEAKPDVRPRKSVFKIVRGKDGRASALEREDVS
jgi:hypothetical protein